MSRQDCIAFAGGGTGGHVFPGLAIIEELKKNAFNEIVWIGSKTGMEKALVTQAQIPFYSIPSGKLRRYFSLQNAIDIFKILLGFIKSIFLLIKLKPRLLFSKGGYVSVPPVAAAALLGIPVITHESDYDPGIATRINAMFAGRILTSFEDTKTFFKPEIAAKVVCTGNPVRPVFFAGNHEQGRSFVNCPETRKMILILGGSLGAERINKAIAAILDPLTAKYFIVHQMGKRGYQPNPRANYYPAPFFTSELPDILAASDLVICRAGSNTLWELAAAATPALLVPLGTTASRGDQLRNAEHFRKKGAAEIVSDADLQDNLLDIITKLINNDEKLEAMRKNLKALGNRQAVCAIAELILNDYRS